MKTTPALTGANLKTIFSLLLESKNVNFSEYKQTTIIRRITRRMLYCKAATGSGYIALLKHDKKELDELYGDLLINVTGFFRDKRLFEQLQKNIIPKLLKKHGAHEPVRIWVAGCSSGEETYSIAILLAELVGIDNLKGHAQIFASDVKEAVLKKARAGWYKNTIADAVSAGRLKRFFVKKQGGYQIGAKLREICTFVKHNVLQDPPFSKIDLLTCRNMLIYMSPDLQRQALSTFHFALNPGGYLVLGSSETIAGLNSDFSLVDNKNNIYANEKTGGPHLQEFIYKRKPQTNASEELKSAYEEIQSINEELRNSNEELETSKEELQSTNEELTTVNEDLLKRNLEITELAKFPSENPNPILRISNKGVLMYANKGAEPLLKEWKIKAGDRAPQDIKTLASSCLAIGKEKEHEISVENKIYALYVSPICDSGYVTMYGRDITKRKKTEVELVSSEERYRTLFNSLIEGFCVIEVIFDKVQKPIDYRFLEINKAFENQTGLHNAQGKLMRELAPDHEQHWFDIYGKIALTGEPAHFEDEAKALGRYYDVRAFRMGGPESRKVAICFSDISERKKAEEAVLASEKNYRDLIEAANSIILRWAPDGTMRYINDYGLAFFGYTREEVIGKFVTMLVPGSDSASGADLTTLIEDIANDPEKYKNNENQNIKKNGERAWITWTNKAVKDEQGVLKEILAIGNDITVLKNSENQLRFQSLLLSKTHDAVFSSDSNYTITYWNKASERMFGWTKEEALGKNSGELLKPKVEGSSRDQERSKMRSAGHWEGETQYIRKDGTYFFTEVNCTILRDANGKDIGNVVVARDITERKKTEEKLKTTLQRFYTILSSMPFAILLVNNDDRIEFANQWFCDTFALKESPAQLMKLTAGEMIEKIKNSYIDPVAAVAHIREIVSQGKPVLDEEIAMNVNRTYLRNYLPIRLGEKQFGRLWVHVDITERKKAEVALRESEEQFRTLAETLPVLISMTNTEDSTIVFTNAAYNEAFGYKKEEIIGGKGPDVYYDPADREKMLAIIREKGFVDNYQLKAKKKDGAPIWLLSAVRPITYGGKPAIVGASIDITERNKAEDNLNRVNRMLRTLSNGSQAMTRAKDEQSYMEEACGILIKDGGYRMAWVGYAEENENKSITPVAHAGFNDGYLDTVNVSWADVECGHGPTGTAVRTGQAAICRNMQEDPKLKPWRERAIKRGYASSIGLPLKDSGEAFGALTIYSTNPDPFTDDEVKLLTEFADDLAYGITAIRLREAHAHVEEVLRRDKETLEKLVNEQANQMVKAQLEVEKSKRLSDIGQLASTIAHELRNPLVAIKMAAYNIKRKAANPNLDKHIENINKKVAESDLIIQNVLNFSKTKIPKFEHVNLCDIIKENLATVSSKYKDWNVELKEKYECEAGGPIEADPAQMAAIFSNILDNAYQALPDKAGSIDISVLQEGGADYVVRVKDSGLGISEENLAKIFDPFFTTKARGTGLGLTVCKELIALHGGKLEIGSKLGEGTTVTITLPKKH